MNKLSRPAAQGQEKFDLKKCKQHRAANSYGMPLNYKIKCECCGKFANKEELTLNFSPIKIYYCGPQLVTYLTILKYLTLLLFLLCITNALPLMIINEKGKSCDKKIDCSPSILLRLSIFNQFGQIKKTTEESYIIFANFILCILFWHILRNQLRKIKTEIDETNFIPSQYTVLCEMPIKNLDKQIIAESVQKWWRLQMKHNKTEMQSLFPKLFEPQEESKQDQFIQYSINKAIVQICQLNSIKASKFIQEIVFSYNYPDFVRQYTSFKIQQEKYQKDLKGINIQDQFKKKQSVNHNLTLEQMNRNKYCLIIFKKVEYAEYFSKRNNPNLLERLICLQNFRHLNMNKKSVNVSNMHYPCEIYWKNHHIQGQQYWKPVIVSICFLFLLILASSGIIYLLRFLYQNYISENKSIADYTFYVLIGLLINLMILIGNKIITVLSQKQGHETYVSQKSKYVYKIVFFNVCLILISPFIILKAFGTDTLWKKNGLIQSEVISLVIYMVAIHIERYLSPSTLKIIRQYSKFSNSQANMSQQQANKKFNKPIHHIDQQYAAVCTIAFINFFLTNYAPYITILSCLWMLIQFWVEKANIAYFYNEDDFHSQLLGNKMVQLVELSFSFLIYGNLSAYIIQRSEFEHKTQIHLFFLYGILCAFCLISVFLPHEKINKKVFNLCRYQSLVNVQDCTNERNYQSVKDRFLEIYEDFNEVVMFYTNISNQSLGKSKVKQIDEMQSISATLSLSLKQRLLNNNDPIISHVIQRPPENQDYFEYEKKINMKKITPKVKVPPLFQKNKVFKPPTPSFKQTNKYQE